VHGVDVTGSVLLHEPRVQAALEFAAHAHAGQRRKTGEPYVAHCIETALIVERNLPRSARQDGARCGAPRSAPMSRTVRAPARECLGPCARVFGPWTRQIGRRMREHAS
jgi:hypothetical protein